MQMLKGLTQPWLSYSMEGGPLNIQNIRLIFIIVSFLSLTFTSVGQNLFGLPQEGASFSTCKQHAIFAMQNTVFCLS